MLIIIMYCLGLCLSLSANEDAHASQVVKGAMGGAAAGIVDTLATQPLTNIKTQLQQNNSFGDIKWRPLTRWWAGTSLVATSQIPTTAVQFGCESALKRYYAVEGAHSNIVTGCASGAVSALICCPIELPVVQKQQYQDVSMLHLVKHIKRPYHALWPTILRESLYTANYMGIQPLIKSAIQQKTDYEVSSRIIAGFIAGIGASLLTHPFDTIKTQMQSDPKNNLSFWHTTRMTLQNERPIQRLYKGIAPRTLSVAIGVCIIGSIFDLQQD